MHIVFKSANEWFEQHPGLKTKFKKTNKTILFAAHSHADFLNRTAQQKIGASVDIVVSDQLLKQSLIDAFDDLLRLTNYHPTDEPNPIKEMAYIVYWLVKRKPIWLSSEETVMNSKLSNLARTKYLFLNEALGVKLLINAAFSGKKQKSSCIHMKDEAEQQLKRFERYLLYYLIYRLNSPKELEAIILAATIHPVWEVDPIIWNLSEVSDSGEMP